MPENTPKSFVLLVLFFLLFSGCMSTRLLATPTPVSTATFTPVPTQTKIPATKTPPVILTHQPTATARPISSKAVVIDARTARRLLELSRITISMPEKILWTEDGSQLGVAAAGGLFVFDALTLALEEHYPNQQPSLGLDYSLSAGLKVVTSDYRSADVQDLAGAEEILQVSPRLRFVRAVVSPAGIWLALLDSAQTNLEVWNITNKTLRGQFRAEVSNSTNYRAQFSQPDDRLILISGSDVQLLNLNSGAFSPVMGHDQVVSDAALSPDKTLVVVSTFGQLNNQSGGILKLWDAAAGKDMGAILMARGQGSRVIFSKNDRLLAASTGNAIQIWNTENWEMLALLEGHEGRITDLSFSPNQRVLVSASNDGTVRFWQVAQIQDETRDLPIIPGTWQVIRHQLTASAAMGKQEADSWLDQEMVVTDERLAFSGSFCTFKSMTSRGVNAADYLMDTYSMTLNDLGISQQGFQVAETDCSSPYDELLILNQGELILYWKGYFFFLERQVE